MNKLILLWVLVLTSTVTNYAAETVIKGKVVDAQTHSSLPGANIILLNSTKGTVANENGLFEIKTDNTNETLVVSFIGYKPDTVLATSKTELEIHLSPKVELNEFTLAKRKTGTHLSRVSAAHTEHLSSHELAKAACCSLAESFETNATVDVSHTDAVSGAKQIKMLGLAGKYVQITTEKLPSVRGVESRFGFDHIPGPWMESISVSKGTSSVVDGFESLTGQINIELKKPEEAPPLFVNAFVNAEGRIESNVIAAHKFAENLSTAILAHTSHNSLQIDNNNDGFIDMPLIKRYELTNKWQYFKNKYVSHYTFALIDENRESGNSLWFDGNNEPDSYGILNKTQHYNFQTKQAIILDAHNESSIAFIFSGSNTKNDSKYGITDFEADEDFLYSSLIFQSKFINAKNKITAGLNTTYRNLNEQSTFIENIFSESTGGLFAEYSYTPSHELVIQIGLRSDYNNLYDRYFVTPRAHLKYEINESIHLRASAGKGYRSPTLLTDFSSYFASSREFIISEAPEMEESFNFGGSIVWYLSSFLNSSFTVDYFRTNFQNKLIADLDTDPRKVLIFNQKNIANSDAFQIEYNFEPIRNLTSKLAFRYNNVNYEINGVTRDMPLNSKVKALFTTSYQTLSKSWQFDFTAKYSGPGRLPDADVNNPLWDNNFNGFFTFNGQITKYFKNFELYLGSENISNYTINNPIIGSDNPYGENFDATLIWGPVLGRTTYLGLRFTLNND